MKRHLDDLVAADLARKMVRQPEIPRGVRLTDAAQWLAGLDA